MALETPATYTNREKTIVYIAVLLGFMLDGYDILITSFVLHPMATYFNVSIGTVAFALTLVLVSSLIGGVFFGWLADKIGRRTVLFITIATYGVATILTGFSKNIPEVYLFRFLTGLGVGGEWGIGYSLLNEAYSEKTRGKAGGFLGSMYVWGSLAGALTADLTLTGIKGEWGWRTAYLIAGFVALLLIIVRLYMPESKVWLRYRELKAQNALPEGYSTRSPLVDIFSRQYLRYTLFGGLFVIGNFLLTYSFLTFIPTYFGAFYKIPVPTYTEMIIIAEVVGIIGYTACGFLSDVIGRKNTAYTFGALALITGVWFYLAAAAAPAFHGIGSFPVLYPYIGMYFSAGFIAHYGVWIGEHFATKLRATGSNFTFMLGRGVGGALPPILVPLWIGLGNLGIAMSIGILIGAVVQFIAIFGLKETLGTKITAV